MNFAQKELMKNLMTIVLSTVLFLLSTEYAMAQEETGAVKCANLIYGSNKSSVCFSSTFVADINKQTNIQTSEKFSPVQMESEELFDFPFAFMTGEGRFKLTTTQQESLRNYLTHGGFLVASAGCSSKDWAISFRSQIKAVFPDVTLKEIDLQHPIFHSYYDIKRLEDARASLEGLEIDGKIVLVFSSDGLNNSDNAADPKCCCCGGNEIENARQVNANLLIYALTH